MLAQAVQTAKDNDFQVRDLAPWIAVVVTLASFWWLNLRSGRLRVIGTPRSYAVSTFSPGFYLNIPLVFINDGPTPTVASNLRLRFEAQGFPDTMPFAATRPGVQPKRDDERPLATSLVLNGRGSVLLCCEFIARPFESYLENGVVPVRVEAFEQRYRGKAKWRDIGKFDLLISDHTVDMQKKYVAHDNYPGGELNEPPPHV